jgi:hypothetical protein
VRENIFVSHSLEDEPGIRKFIFVVFKRLFLALGLTGIVSYLCALSPQILGMMSIEVSIALMVITCVLAFSSLRRVCISCRKKRQARYFGRIPSSWVHL